jgi:hypothetical protein
MKKLSRVLIIAVLINALAPLSAVLAQQSGTPSGEPLREQIARLESIERDPDTSSEVRDLNRSFLLSRRAQLRAELKKRVGALVSYLSTSASLLSEAEAKTVRVSIESLTAELQSLDGDAPPKDSTDSKAAEFVPASFTPTETVSRPAAPPDANGAAAPLIAGGGAAAAESDANPNPEKTPTPECDKTLSDGDTVTYSVVNTDNSLHDKIEKARIKSEDVTGVINGTVYTKNGSSPLDGDYCIVHIIEWLIKGDDQAAASKADVLREHWALYKYDESKKKWVPEPAQKGTRIYGKSRVNVLAIHKDTMSTWDIDYTVSVTKKTPTNIANALDLASIITSGKVAKLGAGNTTTPTRWGGGLMCINSLPSDIAVEGEIIIRNTQNDAVQQPKTYSKTYDNEGKYWWDVSVGVPLKEVKEVQFNSSDGTVTAKEVSRQNAYGFLNIFFGKKDLKSDGFLKTPHLVFGVPISKKPLDRPVIGLGYGIHKWTINFDMYAGVVFNRVREPRTLGVGASATEGQLEADLQTRRVRKFIFGVNLPLRQIKDALSGSK